MNIDFYNVDDNYIEFLRKSEIEERGFSRVPNINKGAKNETEKFYCGIVFEVQGINYFSSISSYAKPNPGNFVIFQSNNKIIGSVRFNYMIPIPNEALHRMDFNGITDPKYRNLVVKEWKYCNKYKSIIHSKAQDAWEAVINKKSNHFITNSCDFPLLERKCIEYCIDHNYEIPHRCDYAKLKDNCFFVKCTAQHKEAIAEILTTTTSDITKTPAGFTIAVHNCHKSKVAEICQKHGINEPGQGHKVNNHSIPKDANRSPNETLPPPSRRR